MRCAPLLVLFALVASGCGEMRPVPSHGGGKRFDEEQRAVSSAVETAVAGPHRPK